MGRQRLTNQNLSILMLLTAAFFWGSTFLFTKELLNHLPVYNIIFGRSVLAAAFLLLVYLRVIIRECKQATKSLNMWLFVLASTIALSLQTEGLKYTTASNSAFITAMFVVFLPLTKVIFYREKIKPLYWTAVFFAVIGLYLISFGFSLPNKINVGDALSLICALFYALSILFLERISKNFSEGFITFFYFTIQSLITSLVIFRSETYIIFFNLNTPTYINLLSLAFLGSVIPYLLMAKGQRYVKSQTASIIYNFEPVSATLLAFFILNESISFHKIFGCFVIFLALIITTKTN